LRSTVAPAADLASPLQAPGQAPPVWTGFYAEVNVGGPFGVSRNAFNIPGFEIPSFDTPLVGVIGGAEVGYNWQTGPWVLGVEANFGGSGLRGS
jgi:outer membrane immunogenic protein